MARVYMQTQPSKKGVTRGTKVSIYLTCNDKLIDSLSKTANKNAKYLDEQRKLMEKEAEEEAARQAEEEAKRKEEERLAAEAAANAAYAPVDGVDGHSEIMAGTPEDAAAAAAEAPKPVTITPPTTVKREDIIED